MHSTTISRARAVKLLCAMKGAGYSKIFGVHFVKRTTGELREMRARLGVTAHLTGAGASYDAAAKNLLCVFDVDKGQYRSINLDAIRRLAFAGVVLTVAAE